MSINRLNSTRRRSIRNSLPQVCVTCGATQNLTLDHIVARGLGGSNERHNFQILCAGCNRRKAVFESEELVKRARAERKLQQANYFREQARQAKALACGKPSECSVCGRTDTATLYEWANLTGNYQDISNYARMCRNCHRQYDKNRPQSSKHVPKTL